MGMRRMGTKLGVSGWKSLPDQACQDGDLVYNARPPRGSFGTHG
jgi:hypothetical protein